MAADEDKFGMVAAPNDSLCSDRSALIGGAKNICFKAILGSFNPKFEVSIEMRKFHKGHTVLARVGRAYQRRRRWSRPPATDGEYESEGCDEKAHSILTSNGQVAHGTPRG